MTVWDPPVQDFQATGVAILSSNLNKMGNSLLSLELVAYGEATSNVVVDVTSAATSQLVVATSPASVAYENVLHVVEFGLSITRTETAVAGPSNFMGLYDAGTAVVSKLARTQAGGTAGTSAGFTRRYFFTPSAANHSYQIRGYNVGADSWTVEAGAAGGGDAFGPAYIAIFRVPT